MAKLMFVVLAKEMQSQGGTGNSDSRRGMIDLERKFIVHPDQIPGVIHGNLIDYRKMIDLERKFTVHPDQIPRVIHGNLIDYRNTTNHWYQ